MLPERLESPLVGELEKMGGLVSFHDILVICQSGIRLTCSSIFLAAGQGQHPDSFHSEGGGGEMCAVCRIRIHANPY